MVEILMSYRPSDVLADDKNTAIYNGREVIKGTIATFIANIDAFEPLSLNS
jgi:hypothetical protein